MKTKIYLFSMVLLLASLSSCGVTKLSDRGFYVNDRVVAAAAADLEVSPNKITYTMNRPPKAFWRAGSMNVVNAAISEALRNNSKADILVGVQYTYTTNAFGKVKSVTVTGFPATYKNFRSVQDEAVAVSAASGVVVVSK